MTAACLDAGFEYVSDEALCVPGGDHGGGDHVVAYPRALLLTPEALSLVGSEGLTRSGIGLGDEVAVPAEPPCIRVATGNLRLAHVVRLVRGRAPARLAECRRQNGLELLLRKSFNAHEHPHARFQLASRLAGRARAWQLEYTDPAPAARLLLRLLADSQVS
jgi:hypothetical protein